MQYRAKYFEILILLYIKNYSEIYSFVITFILLYIKNYSEIYSFVITFNSQYRQIYMLKPQVSQENVV